MAHLLLLLLLFLALSFGFTKVRSKTFFFSLLTGEQNKQQENDLCFQWNVQQKLAKQTADSCCKMKCVKKKVNLLLFFFLRGKSTQVSDNCCHLTGTLLSAIKTNKQAARNDEKTAQRHTFIRWDLFSCNPKSMLHFFALVCVEAQYCTYAVLCELEEVNKLLSQFTQVYSDKYCIN